MSKSRKAIIIIILILFIDQISKIYVKTHFLYGEEVVIFDWFRMYFIENNGMAWGVEFGGKAGKLFLTIFRLLAIAGIGYWLYTSIKKNAHTVLIVAISFIFAGAIGNIIDSVFYGVIFDTPDYGTATLFPEKPYGNLFYGKVVDMLYFPFIEDGVIPSWVPKYGGKTFTFFNAIFNVADTAVSTGVGILIVFNKKAFPPKKES